jgi:hypothetical protein
MAGTNAVTAKKAFVAGIGALPAFEGVTVDYSYVAAHHKRDYVYLGEQIQGPVSPSAMAAGARYQREENLTVMVHIGVVRKGQKTTETAEERAVELGTAIEEWLAGNWKDLAPGLLKVVIATFDLMSACDDDGSEAVLTYTIQLQSLVR